jgi:glutamine amidotransferase
MIRVAVVDYGAGNLVSIGQALEAVGATVLWVRHGDALGGSGARGNGRSLGDADALLVPGVGASAPAMDRLRERGLVQPIVRWIRDGRPYLGICLGLQLLFERSDEDDAETLGVLPGRTVLLEDAPTLPHIGWNQVLLRRPHPLFEGIESGTDFYFVHSYAGRPTGPDVDKLTLGETVHGRPFVSALARGPLVGLQFHPERSGPSGLRLLANFVRLATAQTMGQPLGGRLA